MASHKRAPGSRPAVDRGIPVRVVDVIVEVLGSDEEAITFDSELEGDLHASDMDVVEMASYLGVEETCLDWHTVRDIVTDMKRGGVRSGLLLQR